MSWLRVHWRGIGSILRRGLQEERTGRRKKRERRTTFFDLMKRSSKGDETASHTYRAIIRP